MADKAMTNKDYERMAFRRFVESDMFWVAYAGAFALIILVGNFYVN
ncbi:hypothetical protein CEV31_3951 [Brucella thiophenivorans]|uniref:Uncharacterized protein n=1 Tax=Brucella thiophenivorans TaxID=571255 RepID=A0A256F1S1_9HYPH|nr:hypothetical protein CEV31_3951 [Brucella thiophenivorans]